MSNWKQEYRIRSPFTRRMIRVIGPEGLRTRDEILEALIDGRAMDWNEWDCMAAEPEGVPRPSLADDVVVTFCAVSGGVLWPIYETTVARLRADGYSGQVVVRYGRPPQDEPAPAPSDKPTPSRGMNPGDVAAEVSEPPLGRAWAKRMERLFQGPALATDAPARDVAGAAEPTCKEARTRRDANQAARAHKDPAAAAKMADRWSVDIQADGMVKLTRLLPEGSVAESYRPVTPPEAAVWLAAVSQGFQPPRDLRPVDDL